MEGVFPFMPENPVFFHADAERKIATCLYRLLPYRLIYRSIDYYTTVVNVSCIGIASNSVVVRYLALRCIKLLLRNRSKAAAGVLAAIYLPVRLPPYGNPMALHVSVHPSSRTYPRNVLVPPSPPPPPPPLLSRALFILPDRRQGHDEWRRHGGHEPGQ